MIDDPLLKAYAEAERIEAAADGLLRVFRVDARFAAMWGCEPGFCVAMMVEFVVEPERLREQVVEELRLLRGRLAEVECQVRLDGNVEPLGLPPFVATACPGCGRTFTGKHRDRRVCSDRCRQRAYWGRKAAKPMIDDRKLDQSPAKPLVG